MRRMLERRNAAIPDAINPLPGSSPYNNIRPINVPLRYDRQTVIELLTGMHAQMGQDYWVSECEKGRIVWQRNPLGKDDTVRSGWRIEHLLPQTVEPEVNAQLKIVFEDDELIAVDKPAPLPMHPCGRFNRNSLIYILNELYKGEQIRTCHRLDANTTGIVLCARKKSAARKIQLQFQNGTIKKAYLAEVHGHPEHDEFFSREPITDEPSTVGARTIAQPGCGIAAETLFAVIERRQSTTLLRCIPITGRTNQIRVHLWQLGHAIFGDPLYLPNNQLGSSQTIRIGDPPLRLHAVRLQFVHPISGKQLEIKSKSPTWAVYDTPLPVSL